MEQCKNCKNNISYSDFLNYLNSGDWSLNIGIKDRMTKEEHLSYIDRITTFEDSLIEFIPDDAIPELIKKIDVIIKPTVRESDMSSKSIHIQFTKQSTKNENE